MTKKTGFNNLTKKDYTKTTFRSYFLQNGFNYTNYQGLGYGNILYPALRKIYKNDDEFADNLLANNEFYNTNPQLVPFITSLHLVMADNNESNEDIRGLKMALMGPLAGIGDSLSQFAIAPLFSTIFASLAMDGVTYAPIFFILAINAVLISIRLAMGKYGLTLGTTIIDTLSDKITQISEAANIVGVTVISGLAATFVKMNVNISFAAGEVTEEGQSQVDIQSLLDTVAPALLPILYTLLMYYLIKKKNWNTYTLVILTVILGIVLSYLGILS
ncbi:MAG: PTS system mannose/fructose/sorbose family transporter subunit IID [Staphylococcus equorum]|uniref:PTS system, N-acetylgalactosamine-specific IID component n=1 Tax=Alkalibacterium gilvum TaxID=1130080 RepID=A0A1H6VSF0_9LACT|nr:MULTISPECIES: PTS system mannose/fructose/sorbose family transporter subunit IID [Alkalibacterium]MDN6741931.1 PTS system mannose/fructose/sorbose family transporter subunit IID [Staphylococcus equorum]MDN6294370.1 PTS system mannose/fructose/sorbose family transporter subunit IID [Alkalibacterium sp.]MDN6296041.1 PTS system mannose/fructose/sorbose family transporter subunit IID [Alkalibacterium sp.]SEJ04727.1 PTS system, N-acetylgalactosamine-specific IID component [Alkalibacterium gilvum]